MRRSISAAGLLGLAACAVVALRPPQVAVTEAGTGISLSPRAPDCRIEFYRTKPPDRRYDEVATLHFAGSRASSAADAHEALRAKACEIGADAVIVTLDFITGSALMTGTAVSYPELRDGHRVEHALIQAERRASRENALAATRPAALPDYVGAWAKRDVTVLSEPHFAASEVGKISEGQAVWVSPEATTGYRRTVGGGFVDEDELEFAAAAPAEPARKPAPQPAQERTDI